MTTPKMTKDNRLPKPTKGTRCSAMDMKGKRCAQTAIRQENYHGDYELYGSLSGGKAPVWVRVAFCEKHADD